MDKNDLNTKEMAFEVSGLSWSDEPLEIEENTREVSGMGGPKKVKTYSIWIPGANTCVEVGTNGYHGGDTGNGGRAFIQIGSEGDIKITVDETGREAAIELAGDWEISEFIDCLKFAVAVLEKQIEDRKYYL